MSSRYWFKQRKGISEFGRPANWKGWVALAVFIFVFAVVVQLIARWFTIGMVPAAQGVWLFALLFIVIGAFLSLSNRMSPPSENIKED